MASNNGKTKYDLVCSFNKNKTLNVTFRERFRDVQGSAGLGKVHSALREEPCPIAVYLDFRATTFADPLPLLALSAILRESQDKTTTQKISIDFGDISTLTANHRVFLKFLAEQGFVETFGKFATLSYDNVLYNGKDADKLIDILRKFQPPTLHRNANCIFATLLNTAEYRNDPEHLRLHNYVEEMVQSAKTRLSKSGIIGNDPLVRDKLLQKTRKILFETLCNVVEHAYASGHGYAGVYARMRTSLPGNQIEAQIWKKLFHDERKEGNVGQDFCPGISAFDPNPLAPWIEIFICDTGSGLFHNVEKWQVSEKEYPKAAKTLQEVIRDRSNGNKVINYLHRFSRHLFHAPFSSQRDSKTTTTGLRHLGFVLQQDKDFARVYTGPEWAGSRYPWASEFNTGTGHLEIQKFTDKSREHLCPGTWFSFSIQPEKTDLAYPNDKWVLPSPENRRQLIEALALEPLPEDISNLTYYERRHDINCSLPEILKTTMAARQSTLFTQNKYIILRPPRALQKRHVGQWLERIVEASRVGNSPGVFILADLTPFQAITYAQLLENEWSLATSNVELYLFTEDFAVCCLSGGGKGHISHSAVMIDKASSFLNSDASVPVSAGWLLRLLRRKDSELFWQLRAESNTLPEGMFVSGRIKWPSSRTILAEGVEEENDITINGYLDLSRALVDYQRYDACQHALRRTANLFPEHVLIASDSLVSSLVKDAERHRYSNCAKEIVPYGTRRKKLIIGSIRVTSSTVDRFLRLRDVDENSRVLFLFTHPDASIKKDPFKYLAALDWLPPRISGTAADSANYERIPETPFVGSGGEKAITIPRFVRPTAGSKEFKESFYTRDPQHTYDDFNKDNLIKFGHWTYGEACDLITVNLGRAWELSIIEGGQLFTWLRDVIRELCYTNTKARNETNNKPRGVLVYPSHPVTDRMITDLSAKRGQYVDSELAKLFSDYVIPIRFISNTSVSPFRIAPLVYEQLCAALKNLRDENINEKNFLSRIVILDDGTLTGKIFREVQQIARAVGFEEIHTIAIVDRTGLPVEYEYMKHFIPRSHRFWRWDVPRLGRRLGCPLCSALHHIDGLLERKRFDLLAEERLERWKAIWKPVDVLDHWETHGLRPIPLGQYSEKDGHNLGICVMDNGNVVKHRVHHSTSTSMAAGIMEILRSTPRSYYGLKKARELTSCLYQAEVGIEILAAQILLFLSETDEWTRLEVFSDLLKFLWDCYDDSDFTALAGISMTLVDDATVSELWPRFKESIIRKRKVTTTDASIAANILRDRYNSPRAAKKKDKISESATLEEKYNYDCMFSEKNFRSALSRLFEIIWEEEKGRTHHTGLRNDLEEIEELIESCQGLRASENDIRSKVIRKLHSIKVSVNNLINILRDLSDMGESDPQHEHDIHGLIKSMPIIDQISNASLPLIAVDTWVKNLVEALYETTNINSIAVQFRTKCVYKPNSLESKEVLLRDVCSKVEESWQNIIDEKKSFGKHLSPRWNESVEKPIFEYFNPEIWENESDAFFFHECVQGACEEILANAVHAPEDITNPWILSEQKETGFKATMWWRVLEDDRYVEIIFVNASELSEITLAPTPFRTKLERAGGVLECFVFPIDSRGNMFPSSLKEDRHKLISELKGIQTGQRVAVTQIRTPKMKTVREG